MKKFLGIVVLSLLWCNVTFADCGLSKKVDVTAHWSGDSAWRLEFFNHNSQAIVITEISYYSTKAGASNGILYRTYKENIRVNGNSERSYVHSTNMNYDMVKSFATDCVKASSIGNSDYLKPFQKKSWFADFKWWEYVLIALVVLGIIGAISDANEKSSGKSKKKPISKATTSSKNSPDNENLIEDVWEGRKPLGESFWLYYFLVNGVISVGAGYLADANDNNIFLIAALISNVWAGVGTWNSSTNYQLQKIKDKQPYGFAYAAKIMIVLNFITIIGQAILLFG